MRRRRLRSARPRAFSLLEVFIAGVLFVVAVTGVVSSWRTVSSLAETQVRRGEALTLAEDTLDDLRLCFRGSADLAVGDHERFFDRDRNRVGAVDARGYQVSWTVTQIPSQTFKRVDLVVQWTGVDGRPHALPFVTYRSS